MCLFYWNEFEMILEMKWNKEWQVTHSLTHSFAHQGYWESQSTIWSRDKIHNCNWNGMEWNGCVAFYFYAHFFCFFGDFCCCCLVICIFNIYQNEMNKQTKWTNEQTNWTDDGRTARSLHANEIVRIVCFVLLLNVFRFGGAALPDLVQ